MGAAPRVTWVIDGALDQPTGGYLYDRLVVDGLRARGFDLRLQQLTTGGALHTLRESARVAAAWSRLPDGALLVVDELCHPRVALAAALPRTKRALRLVALVHHLAASERSGLSSRARLALERVLLDASALMITTSHTTRRVLIAAGLPASRVVVILPGRDRLGTRDAPPDPSPDGALRLLFIGAITPRKGVLPLVRAFASIAPRASLTLVGPVDRDPRYASAVRAEIARSSGAIRLTGHLDDEALRVELGRHDLLVLPSLYEGFGIVLAEALSHGLGVIATTAGAIPEVVRDGEEALLVPPGDERALARALARVAADRARVTAMQAHALTRAHALPRWRDTQARFAEALITLSDGSR